MPRPRLIIEIYKCAALTAIGVLLFLILQNTPTPFTQRNLQAKIVDSDDVPVVWVRGRVTADIRD